MVLVSYMVCDTLYYNFSSMHMMPVVISNSIHIMSHTVSRILVIAASSFLFSIFHLVGQLAYERYCYFVIPLRYTIKFTKSRIITAVILIYFFSLCLVLTIDLISPRSPVATTLTYQTKSQVVKITNIIFTVVYAIPSGTMNIITLIKLRLLISKHRVQVSPTQSDVMKEEQSAVSGLIVKPVKKTLRMIGLVSCSFWLTIIMIIPGFVIRIGLTLYRQIIQSEFSPT